MIIIIIVYLINNNNNKYNLEKQLFDQKQTELNNMKVSIDKTNNKIKDIENINNIINNPKEYERLNNPLLGPERSFPYSINKLGVPINIKTRGEVHNYQQVGALYQEGEDTEKKVFPLYGKPTYPGSNKWLYYTGNDNYSSVKLPISNNGRMCQDDQGCEEIMSDDIIDVTGYNNKFRVNIYKLDKPRYIPYVI